MEEKNSENETKQEFDDTEFYKGKDLLIDIESYLKSGVHIGTKFKTGEMRRYIFKKRKDGLMVFNIETIDKRIRMTAKLLAKYHGKEIAIMARRLYGHKPARKMSSMIGAKEFTGRFIPGTFTNPQARIFYEPKIVLVTDPIADAQAIKEASEIGIPVIALAGSDSPTTNIDLIIPANNKGRKSLALIYYLLTRETLVERKELSRETFSSQISDFEQEIDETQ
jgi:small subunit ribosomal protein S2